MKCDYATFLTAAFNTCAPHCHFNGFLVQLFNLILIVAITAIVITFSEHNFSFSRMQNKNLKIESGTFFYSADGVLKGPQVDLFSPVSPHSFLFSRPPFYLLLIRTLSPVSVEKANGAAWALRALCETDLMTLLL